MIYLFDIDGVINKADYFSVQYEKDFGIDKSIFDSFFINEFSKCANGFVDIKSLLPKYFNDWKWNKNAEEFLNYWFQNDINIDFELVKRIQKLREKGHQCILVSQQEKHRKTFLWEDIKLKDYFDDFYATCDFGFLKSEVQFYIDVISSLKKDKLIESEKDCLYWDDTFEFVEIAKKAGIPTIYFKNNSDILNVI